MKFLENLPEDVTSTIPQELADNPAFANVNSISDLMQGYLSNTTADVTPPTPPEVPDWTSGLEEGQKSMLETKGWKTPADIVKSYSEIEKYMGGDKIPAPRKRNDGSYEDGELERYLRAVGYPAGPEEYKLPEGFELPEGQKLDDEWLQTFNAMAHKAGLLPDQYNFIMSQLQDTIKTGFNAKQEEEEKIYNDAANKLRAKFGLSYNQNVALANKVLNTFADRDLGTKLMDKYTNDPFILGMLANVGKSLSEEGLTKVGVSGSMMTPDVAQTEIRKVMADTQHPYYQGEHPEHKYWVDRLEMLHKMAYPG